MYAHMYVCMHFLRHWLTCSTQTSTDSKYVSTVRLKTSTDAVLQGVHAY